MSQDQELNSIEKVKSLKIGIVGYGVIGQALSDWFTKYTPHEVKVMDPAKKREDDLSQTDIAFVCIPVETNSQKQQDLNDLTRVVLALSRENHQRPILVRSTVLPGTCDELAIKAHGIVIACPEFLTERRAEEDMKKLPIVVGMKEKWNPKQIAQWRETLTELWGEREFLLMTNKEAELSKYTHNCFAALKVNYFNHIQMLCEDLKSDYQIVKHAANVTGFLGKEHLQVPGHDKRFGFGGKCLPKDLAAFMGYLRDRGHAGFRLLAQVIQDNTAHRTRKAPMKRVSTH